MKRTFFLLAMVAIAISATAQNNDYYRRQNYRTNPQQRTYQQRYSQQRSTAPQTQNYRIHIHLNDNNQQQQQFYEEPMPMQSNPQLDNIQMQLNAMQMQLNNNMKREHTPGDYLVYSGRWAKATFWSLGLGAGASGGLYYYSTTENCKDPKAFRTAAIATAGATAVVAFACWMTNVHYRIKAGKRLNVTMGANGAELTYNF